MKKIYLILLLLFILPINIYAIEYPKINSKIVEIYDLTDNKIIFEIDSNKKTSIASLTKIVTTITAIENISNLNDKITITWDMLKHVRSDASVAGLKVKDIVTYEDLLYASILPSGADATNSLAVSLCGSIESFVNKMNELVNKIGVTNTHFVNVTGLDDEGHYSTIDDVRKILVYALNNEIFKKIYTTYKYELSNGLKVTSTLDHYNKKTNLDTSKILGSKTGFTQDAGYCLSSISNINNHEFIIITAKAESNNNTYYNIVDTVNLINFLENNYNYEILVNKDDLIKTINVNLSDIDNYEIKANDNIEKFLPKDYDKNKIKIEYNGLEELSFNNKIDDKIGTINYYYDNELIKTEEVIINKEIKINFIKILQKYYFVIIIIITILGIIILKRKKS